MSSYFDALVKKVANLDSHDPEAFVSEVAAIENVMIDELYQVTGDREFPDDLRERILNCIVTRRCAPLGSVPSPLEIRERVIMFGRSILIDEMHELFHEVARSRITTRFGLLGDSPRHILAMRAEYERELHIWRSTENDGGDRC